MAITVDGRKKKKASEKEMLLVMDADGEINYKATFDSLTEKGCHVCVKAGFGWSEEKQRCGGFENDKCKGSSGTAEDNDEEDDWEDESDDPDLEGYAAPGEGDDDDVTDADGDINYVKLFAKLTNQGCEACVKKGYGWSNEKKRCGGFANTRCNGKEIEMEDDQEDEDDESENPGWKDTDTTTKLWKLISGGKYDALKALLDENPSHAKVRSADGRGKCYGIVPFHTYTT